MSSRVESENNNMKFIFSSFCMLITLGIANATCNSQPKVPCISCCSDNYSECTYNADKNREIRDDACWLKLTYDGDFDINGCRDSAFDSWSKDILKCEKDYSDCYSGCPAE